MMDFSHWADNVRRVVLPTGLTLLVERNTSAPVVAVVTHVAAGYFDEPDEWVGIAHVLEHMFFKGTERHPGNALAQTIQRVGGSVNAGTIYDKTVYYAVAPSTPGTLRTIVRLQADALTHAKIDPAELAKELEVIVQEAKRKTDTPAAVTTESLYASLFAKHRMRRWRIGTENELRRLTADDVSEYYRTRYVPRRTVVAMVGDLDVDRAIDLAHAAYGCWVADDVPREPSPVETTPPPPALRVIRGDIKRPLAAIGWRTVPALHPDSYPLDIAAMVLGAGRGSWLTRAVRTPGLASTVRGGHYTPTEVGVFDIGLSGSIRHIETAVTTALGMTARLADPGPQRWELQRVRSLAAMQWARRCESMEGRGSLLCEFESLGGLDLIATTYDATQSVTGRQVRDVARRHLRPGAAAAILYLPAAGPSVESLAWPPQSRTAPGLSPLRVPRMHSSGSHAATRMARSREYPGRVHHVPLRGVDILLREKRGSGLVFLGVYVSGMRGAESERTAGVSALLTRTAVRGAAGMNAEQLAIVAEGLGGVVVPSAAIDAVGWGITVRAEALRDAANLMMAIASESTLLTRDLEVERSLQASDAGRARDDMFGYPIRRVLHSAFPDSVYGLPALGDEEFVEQLSDEFVREWAQEFRSRRPAVVAAGDLSWSAMAEGLIPFAKWPTAPGVPGGSGSPATWRAARGVETRDKAQSALALAFPAPRYGSPTRFATMVLGSLLSGLSGRLFVTLREERSLAYTVAALPYLKRDAGAMVTYIATSPGRLDEAREAMLGELRRVSDEEIPAEELVRARNHVAGNIELRQQNTPALAAEMLEGWLHGDLSHVTEVPDRLRAVDSETVRLLAGKIFDAASRAEFVLEGTGRARDVV